MTSRNNPWGTKTYAELISEAILSSPRGRLSLAQIYDQLLSILPYPNHKIDNSSYAGWKNSIRHNLSLHERFVKIPNERPGKPCWWTVNMEKPVGKKQRKSRSQEMEIIGLPEIQCQECHHHHPAQVYPPEGQYLDKQIYGETELITALNEGAMEGLKYEEYREDVFDDGECDIINDIERIQQALLGLSSIETEAEFREVFAEL